MFNTNDAIDDFTPDENAKAAEEGVLGLQGAPGPSGGAGV